VQPTAPDDVTDPLPSTAYVPLEQDAHTVAPVLATYVPDEQAVHTDAPAPEYVPAAQFVHVTDEDAPVAAEYVPAGQFE